MEQQQQKQEGIASLPMQQQPQPNKKRIIYSYEALLRLANAPASLALPTTKKIPMLLLRDEIRKIVGPVNLPEELWCKIFEFLSTYSIIGVIGSLNKRFQHFSLDRIERASFDYKIPQKSFNAAVSKMHSLFELNLEHMGQNLTDEVLFKLLQNNPSMHTLNVAFCNNVSEPVMQHPRLKSLTMVDCDALRNIVLIDSSRSLEQLVLTSCPLIEDEAITRILANSPNLKYLSIINLGKLESPDFSSKSLQHLRIADCAGVKSPTFSCPSLRSLAIQYSDHLMQDAITQFLQAKDMHTYLHSISISNCKRVRRIHVEDSQQLPALKSLELCHNDTLAEIELNEVDNLEELILVECGALKTVLYTVSPSVPNAKLKYLKIDRCRVLTEESLRALMRACSGSLETCILSQSESISFEPASGLNSSELASFPPLHSLRTLRLCGYKSATEAFINSITTLCPRLEHLDLTNTNIPETLTLRASNSLRFLNLASAITLSDIVVEPSAEDSAVTDFPNLERLVLSGCQYLGTKSLDLLLKKTPNLSTLNIAQCKALQYVNIDRLHRLTTVDARGCYRLTKDSIRSWFTKYVALSKQQQQQQQLQQQQQQEQQRSSPRKHLLPPPPPPPLTLVLTTSSAQESAAWFFMKKYPTIRKFISVKSVKSQIEEFC